jgi:mono/diheme cytochrome c family protein
MSGMKYLLLIFSAGAIAFGGAGRTLVAQEGNAQRGKYLVEEVARCQECHTPKMDSDFDRSKWLKGAKLSVEPVGQIPRWHAQSPDITSTSALWQRWGDDGLVKFFETARNPRGGKADVPMPAYTLNHEDAMAIVAYLKSLP